MLSVALALVAASPEAPQVVVTQSASSATKPPAYSGPLDVALRQGAALLWQGRVEVGERAPTYLNFSLTQPPAGRCPVATYQQTSSGYKLSINPRRYGETTLLGVQAEWIRLEPGSRTCDGQAVGTRTVRIDDSVRLEPGRSVVLRGDADFTVTLTRP
jgi:hypothetical protein